MERDPAQDQPDRAPEAAVVEPGEPPPTEPPLTEPTTASQPAAAPPGTAPPAIPPPVNPTPPVSPNDPMPPMPHPAQKKRSLGAGLGVALAIGGAALGAIFVKFVLPLILVGAAGQVFDAAFGGPYMRLPEDVRAGFEQRIETAVGDRFEGQSDAEQTASILALVKGGLPRLDDGLVTTNFQLTGKAIGAVDVASCAAVSRAFVTGSEPPNDPITAMVGTLTDAELGQWFEIRVSAIEDELAGSPAAIDISDEEVAPLYDKIFAIMEPAHIQTIGSIAGGQSVEDEPLCEAVRGLYSSVLTLPTEDVTLFARYDVSP
jgi:hypothetical protein